MTTFAAASQAMEICNFATGSFTSDNTLITLTLGFRPRYFRLINITDIVINEKYEGNPASTRVNEVAAGTVTVVADSAITFNADNSTVSITAALALNAKAHVWAAWG